MIDFCPNWYFVMIDKNFVWFMLWNITYYATIWWMPRGMVPNIIWHSLTDVQIFHGNLGYSDVDVFRLEGSQCFNVNI